MATAAHTLAKFATELRFSDIPTEIVEHAKACMTDTAIACASGAKLPESRLIIGFAERNSAPGNANVIGTNLRVRGGFAALANAALAHASGLDCSFEPDLEAHPGAVLTSCGLAVAQQRGNSGRELIAAFVAGAEVIYRIASSMQQSSEELGFRPSGLSGVFGATVVTGRLMKLDGEAMANALDIGGMLCPGPFDLPESDAGMARALRLGRIAESAVTAAAFAREGLKPPANARGGRLNFFKRDNQVHAERLTAKLGEVWHTMNLANRRCYGDVPELSLSREALRKRIDMLIAALPADSVGRILTQLQTLESVANMHCA